MLSTISFVLDGRLVTLDCTGADEKPTTTVLNYLRSLPDHQGTKRGCDEGDCGACTIVLGTPMQNGTIEYKAVTSCLMFLPMLHGKHVITVENLRDERNELHPVQKAMVDNHGSQCGFCTPGIVMSLFGLYKNEADPDTKAINHALTGNLCRCTGYDDIVQAARRMHANNGSDHFIAEERSVREMLKSIPAGAVHLKTSDQQYFLPTTLAEAAAILADHPKALLLNGATDIGLKVTKRYEFLPEVIDLSHVPELHSVNTTNTGMEIGAGVPLQHVMDAVQLAYPALHSMLSVFGSQQIRSLATLGGNIGTASPISDTPPVLMAYNASIVLTSSHGKRTVPIRDFITGYRKTDRKADEIITSVILPKPAGNSKIHSYKIAKRHDFDIATVSGGFSVSLDDAGNVADICLAYGGMAAFTKRASATENFIVGKIWSRDTIEEAAALLDTDFQPISDVRASAGMRRIAAKNLLMKFWTETEAYELAR